MLLSACALPFVGLVLYFLSTGLHREIAVAQRERVGLAHVRQTVTALQSAVRLSWSENGDDPRALADLDAAIASLDAVEKTVSGSVANAPVVFPASANQKGDMKGLWTNVKVADPGSTDRFMALRQLAARLHQGIFETTNDSGLSAGPENEISALTDVVAVCLPLHVERLLHMHETMVSDLENRGWDQSTITAAGIFARQIEDEDIKRLVRSINAALDADAHSAHVVDSFQSSYRIEGETIVEGLQKLSAAVKPMAGGAAPPVPPKEFDDVLNSAFESAINGWNVSISQLDVLVGDQIHEAEIHRDHALWIAGTVLLLLLPLSSFYFRFFIRPQMQALVDDAAKLQREAEEARAEADESTRRLRQTQEALYFHSAIAAVGLDHKIIAVNERLCLLSGYRRAELVGRDFNLVAGSLEQASESIWEQVSGGETWQGTLHHPSKSGESIWVNATIFPFIDQAGKVVEFVAIETDITELVQAREAAEAAVRAKSQFLAMMSHEIRTPMNGVIGFAQLLAETRLDEEQRDYARTILTSGESLLVIINDILDFSKLEAEKTELELRPVVLRLLVEDTLDLLATQARAKNLELVYWIDPSVPDGILADGLRLRQVLLNLAGNAVKFTGSGHVEISISVDGESFGDRKVLVFHVRDTGIGIPLERQNHLFKAFTQVDASISRNFGGTGLGLAISQRLIKIMGGQISLKSKPGEGSDFFFRIPVTESDVTLEMELRAPGVNDEIAKALNGRRVLVVDDLPANQWLLAKIFEQYGAKSVFANSGTEALAALDAQEFDLGVLDYLMPHETGIELARKMRQKTGEKNFPLILVASVQPERRENPREFFDAVMLKPIRVQPFAAAVARVLQAPAADVDLPLGSPQIRSEFAKLHPLRIAVVDDNAVNLKVITLTLRSLGYQPESFNNAATALEQFLTEAFDLILMDVQMPDIDGHEATRRLRKGPAGSLNRDCRIIALTAGAMAEERDACHAAGMDDFIAKPISREELMTKLTLAGSSIVRQLGTAVRDP